MEQAMDTKDEYGRHYNLVNIRRGKGARAKYIYAELRELGNNSLAISATLDYIVTACAERSYHVENYMEAMAQVTQMATK